MVTQRKVYTKKERLRLIHNPLKLIDAYERNGEIGIVLPIRYDQTLKTSNALEEAASRLSEGPFFLFKHHYEQLKFTMSCLRWNLEITYEDLRALFYEVVSDVPNNTPLIVQVGIRSSGDVHISVEEAEPVENMFMGLLDQFQAILMQNNQEIIEPFLSDVNLQPLYACIDTDSTLPCYATSFLTDDKSPYMKALERVYKYHGRLLDNDYESESDSDRFDDEIEPQENANPFESAASEGSNAEPLEYMCNPPKTFMDFGVEVADVTHTGDEVASNLREMVPQLDYDVTEDNECNEMDRSLLPLMFNPVHQVMSCGEWTVCFYREGKWYTPHIATGCRNDPLRMLLLELKVIEEGLVRIQGVEQDEDILLISASKGIQRARVFGNAPELLYKHIRNRKPKSRTKPVSLAQNETAAAAAERSSKLLCQQNVGANQIPNTGVFRISTKKHK